MTKDSKVQERLVRLALVKVIAGRRDISGEIECPTCGGVLKYVVRSCGKMAAMCSTRGCVML